MIQNERASRHEHVLDVARHITTAARISPKVGKGVDIIDDIILCYWRPMYLHCSLLNIDNTSR